MYGPTVTYCNLHFFDAGVDVKDCIVTRTNDGFVLDDDDLKKKKKEHFRGLENQIVSLDTLLLVACYKSTSFV